MTKMPDPSRIAGSILVLVCSLLLAACVNSQEPQSEYVRQINQSRIAKDIQFFDPEGTVMRPKELANFTGLRYFPVDSAYRFMVPFKPIDPRPTVLIAKQKSGPIPYEQIGYVPIPGPDTTIDLSVFWYEEMAEGTGWIPFTDASSNIDTYGGGRYLDIELRDDGMAVVDFNLAFNPFCVYNPYDYNCAIPPSTNRLTFRMPAGEKKTLLLDD